MTAETILTPEQVDTLLESVLRASGSRLGNYTYKKSLDDLHSSIRAIEQAVLISPEIQTLRTERDTLEMGLRELIRGYVNLLEIARDRIIDLGSTCDPVDVMEASDPFLRSARSIISAMLAAAPQPDHIPDAGKMIDPVVKDSLTVEPTDTEMLDWLIRKNASVEHFPFHPIDDKFLVVNPYDDTLTSASNPREAIAKAMRGEK